MSEFPKEYRAESITGTTLALTVHDYENEFRFTAASDAVSVACGLRPKDARALRDCLNQWFKHETPAVENPGSTAERLAQLIEFLSKEPEQNRLAIASFVAGYFGFRIAP